jgi:ankyrin repeat protein
MVNIPIDCLAKILSYGTRECVMEVAYSASSNRCLHNAVMKSFIPLERLLITRYDSIENAMVCMVERGQYRVVSLLLNASYPKDHPHIEYHDAFLLACKNGDNKMVRLFLDSNNGPRADCQDNQALIIACQYGLVEIVRILLGSKNAPRADCHDGLCLVLACSNDNLELIRLLLRTPYAPSVECRDGLCLMIASRCDDDNAEMLEILIEELVSKSQKDSKGWSWTD